MRHALKEWDVNIRALESGRGIVLARKGGIVEQRDGFAVTHKCFWLYPTFLHQNAGELHAHAAQDLRLDSQPGLQPSTVRFQSFAEAVEVRALERLEDALRLEALQNLNAETLKRRFWYRNRPVLHALLLRVYRLPKPLEIPETPAFAGCVSWVDLGVDVSSDATPVLDDAAFGKQLTQARVLLDTSQ